jgi:hypothetical protein
MRFFRRKRPCEACGKVVGRTEKAVEFSFRDTIPTSPPIIVHQSCWDASPQMSYEIAAVPEEGFSAKPS